MNRIFLLTCCFVFLSFEVNSQNTKVIQLDFSSTDFSYEENESGQLDISSNKYNITFDSDTLTPALPYVSVNVLIREYEDYVQHAINYQEIAICNNVVIEQNSADLSTNNIVETICTDSITYPTKVYPDTIIEYVGEGLMDGYKFVTFLICPFRYNASTHILYLKHHITLTLNLSEGDFGYRTTDRSARSSTIGNNMHDLAKEMAVNGYEIDSVSGPAPYHSPQLAHGINNRQYYQSVIVTSQALASAFQTLANWKTRKGIRTRVVTVEDIYNEYPGTDAEKPLRIKQALKDYYNGSNYCGLEYVLLGGDINIVPKQGCYARVKTKNGWEHDNSIPTDLFYGCFDTMNWDTNNNGIYGEVNDNVDIMPEVIVTRLSVCTIDDVNTIVNRIINYESNPDLTNWHDNILMCGCQLSTKYIVGGYPNHFIYESDAQYKSERMFNSHIAPYWTGTLTKLFDTGTDFAGGANYEYNATHLQEELSHGYSFIHVNSHGTEKLFQVESGYYYDYLARTLQNNRPSIIVTSACSTNAFDYHPLYNQSYSTNMCLSEVFMRNADSGILAYLGCSRYGWGKAKMKKFGTSNWYNAHFFETLFQDKEKHFGEVVLKAKTRHCGQSKKDGSWRWVQFGLNPIGDPEMPIYTEMPKRFNSVHIISNSSLLNINTNVDSCKICIMSLDDEGASCYYVDSNISTLELDLPYSQYSICITKPGYIPYIITKEHGTEYLQNETIEDEYSINCNNVVIGSNVTTTIPEGPVILENGSEVDIHGITNVYIKNDFTVKQGATLNITTGN